MELTFLDKLDFENFFNLKLTQYAKYIEDCKCAGQCNYRDMEAAKTVFRESLFTYCERMIIKRNVIPQSSSQQDNASTEVPSGGESGKVSDSST